MTRYLDVHPDNPQPRHLRQAVGIIRDGGVVAYPTDSCYALGCQIVNKNAIDRIRRIREADKNHHFTLVCSDLSEISHFARVSNPAYRILKAHTPGPYTFILRATGEVPKRLQHAKRKTIGIRVPDNTICQALLAELGEPIISSTLQMPGDDLPLNDPYIIRELLDNRVECIIDGGNCGFEPTTVVDLEQQVPRILRHGAGDVSQLGA